MRTIILILTICLHFQCFCQTFDEQFKEICEEGKLLESEEFLSKWKEAEPNAPEMLIGYFNYYLVKSKSKIGNPDFLGGYVVSGDEPISIDEVNKNLKEKDSLFQISLEYLDNGIKLYPNRLDMHIGKLNTLIEEMRDDDLIEPIKSLIRQNHLNKGKWFLAGNEEKSLNENEFIDFIQGYIYHIMTSNSSKYEELILISELGLKTYENNYVLLSNIGVCNLQLGKYDDAIDYFKNGLKSNPDDLIIRFNIADAYTQLNQTEEAKKYYKEIIDKGTEEYSKMANELLEKLQ